jgi:hypothetical protein
MPDRARSADWIDILGGARPAAPPGAVKAAVE